MGKKLKASTRHQPLSCYPSFSWQVLTRQDQIKAKKAQKGKEKGAAGEDGNDEDEDGDSGDDAEEPPTLKKPAAKIQEKKKTAAPKEKAKAKAKPKAKAKAKAKAEDETPKDDGAAPKSKPRRRKKAADDVPQACPSELLEESQKDDVHEEKVFPEKADAAPARKRQRRMKDPPGESKPEDPEAAKAPKRKRRRSKGPQAEADPKAEAVPKEEAVPKKKAKTSKKGKSTFTNAAAMEDPTMKGVILQMIKEVKDLDYQEAKSRLSQEKEELEGKHANLNVYWSKGFSSVRLLLDPAKPDVCCFNYKQGNWNVRMAAAFTSSWLMVTRFFQD